MSAGVRVEDIPGWLCRDHCNCWNVWKGRCDMLGEKHCVHPWAEWAVEKENEETNRTAQGGSE